MRFILCFLLALGTAAPAWADNWVHVKETKDVVFYIDPSSISKDGHLRKAWELMNLKRRSKSAVMSTRALFEYDCKMQKVRILSGVSYSKPMAEGEILSSFSTYDWQKVTPGTDDVVTFKFVCAK
jgi:hypothetical protein